MSDYSPYAIAESDPPKWKPGEENAAAAFVGMAILLVFDINIGMWRIFKKSQGVYYWSMKLGTLFCLVDALGVILKYLTPNPGHIWGLYTFLLLTGWTVYAPAQLLVLYSRLHLINDSYKIQRGILILVCSTSILLIIPTWIVVWPAYDTDPKISSLWSPRDAIVERYNQIGFTVVEFVISGIYIWSLLGLLNLKSGVRQRRVFFDIIYVNLIILSFDILVVILVYLNQTGISHPMQTFSYALKLKLEFVVLNQLMAVAARGKRKENFEERRYHHGSKDDEFTAKCNQWDKLPSGPTTKDTTTKNTSTKDTEMRDFGNEKSSPRDSVQLTLPSPTLSRRHEARQGSGDDPEEPKRASRHQQVQGNGIDATGNAALAEDNAASLGDEDAGNADDTNLIRHKPSEAFSGETLHSPKPFPAETSPNFYDRQRKPSGQQESQNQKQKPKQQESQTKEKKWKGPFTGTIIRHVPKNGRHSTEEEDEEELDVQMWESKKGRLMMEVPWFETKPEV